MRNAKYLREQAKLSLEIARQLSDPGAAARVRLNAATFLAEADEIEQQARAASTPQIHGRQKHWSSDQGGAFIARSSDPDPDFCVGYKKVGPDLENWRDKPPLSLDDIFRNPAVQERVGKMIARAMRRSVCS